MTKSSPSIWNLLHNVKSTVKILSIFVAFLENMNFKIWTPFFYFRVWLFFIQRSHHIRPKVTVLLSLCFLRRPQKLTKSSLSFWHYAVSVKSTVKILSIFLAFIRLQVLFKGGPYVRNYGNYGSKIHFKWPGILFDLSP